MLQVEDGVITRQELLDAMDGIVMIIDRQLRIVQVGAPNWRQFMAGNPLREAADEACTAQSVLQGRITQFFAGSRVRDVFTDLFESVLGGARRVVRIDYRCDAPGLRRDMRLTVGPIRTGGEVSHLLYQSVQLSAEPRAALPLFGAPVAEGGAEDLLTLCAICAKVAWPVGAPAGQREWIEPSAYYRLGGGEVASISHGFCEPCFDRLQRED